MTLPVERTRAIRYARDFLYDLLDPKKTPRVPKQIRDRARRHLRHFPSQYEISQIVKKCPNILEEETDKEV